MPIPVARTPREEYLYIDLHPCLCGESSLPTSSGAVLEYADDLASQTEGTCPGCGALRIFVFGMPPYEPGSGLLDGYGGPQPSQLVDPGEWLACAIWFAGTGEWAEAVLAVEEIGKFVPPGAPGPAEESFASVAGRDVRAALPEAFRPAALAERARAYRAGRLLGDEARLPAISRDQPDSLGRDAVLESLIQRMRRLVETRDPSGVLHRDTETELVALLGPGSTPDLVGVMIAGHLRWARFGALPPGQGRPELAEALRHFDAYRAAAATRPDDLPRPIALLLEHCDVG